jgi:hypothetical protein
VQCRAALLQAPPHVQLQTRQRSRGRDPPAQCRIRGAEDCCRHHRRAVQDPPTQQQLGSARAAAAGSRRAARTAACRVGDFRTLPLGDLGLRLRRCGEAGSRPPGSQEARTIHQESKTAEDGDASHTIRVFVGTGLADWESGSLGVGLGRPDGSLCARGRDIGLAVANGKMGWVYYNSWSVTRLVLQRAYSCLVTGLFVPC